MTALGVALIVGGLTLVCASMILRLFRNQEPASSEAPIEEGPFRIHDEMWRERDEPIGDSSAHAERVPDDHQRRDQQHAHDGAAADAVLAANGGDINGFLNSIGLRAIRLSQVKGRAQFALPLGLFFVYTNNNGEAIKNCTKKIQGPPGWREVRRNDSCPV
jgi:hypothetical protein